MDCEKFESTLMDELYEELDELTSAASKRHVAGCARCAGLLHGLSATRRVAILEPVEPPAGLEERILAATKEAQKVVPLRGRISRVVSWAGSWAMRPQTAMAAVFLLMIGTTSVLLLRGRAGLSGFGSPAMVVTDKGAPASSGAPADEQDTTLDPSHAAGAHGAFEARKAQSPAPPAAAASAAVNDSFLAKEELEAKKADETRSGIAAADEREPARGPVALAEAPVESAGELNSGASAGAPAPAPAATYPSQAVQQQQQRGGVAAGFDGAMATYRAKNYEEATRAFDALAVDGNVSASLMAARSVREGSGCPDAVVRFDQVSNRAFGTQAGYDATFEAGRCYRSMGQLDAARTRFARLLTVPTHAVRAQAELDAISPKVGRQAAPQGDSQQATPPQAAPPPPAAKMKPPVRK